MRNNILFFILLLACISCKEVSKPAPQKSVQAFEIPGTVEQVIQTNADGSHKVSVFTDKSTNQKVAEVEFHPNGQPKIDKRFVNDTLNGESWCYYQDGKPWSLNTFKRGVNDGPYKTWHENGQLYIDGQYVEGKENGEWFTYYPSGVINTRGIYKLGKKVGVWSSYNMEGSLRREQDFDKPQSE